jgi:hypothetical protein
MPAYVYKAPVFDVGARLTGCTGLVPSSTQAAYLSEWSVSFVSPLTAEQKFILDDFMLTRGCTFLREDELGLKPTVASLVFGGRILATLGLVQLYLPCGSNPNVEGFTAPVQVPVDGARTARYLRARVTTNLLASSTSVTLWVDGLASALAVTIPGGSAGSFSNLTTAVAIPDGSYVDVRVENTAGGLLAVLALTVSVAY